MFAMVSSFLKKLHDKLFENGHTLSPSVNESLIKTFETSTKEKNYNRNCVTSYLKSTLIHEYTYYILNSEAAKIGEVKQDVVVIIEELRKDSLKLDDFENIGSLSNCSPFYDVHVRIDKNKCNLTGGVKQILLHPNSYFRMTINRDFGESTHLNTIAELERESELLKLMTQNYCVIKHDTITEENSLHTRELDSYFSLLNYRYTEFHFAKQDYQVFLDKHLYELPSDSKRISVAFKKIDFRTKDFILVPYHNGGHYSLIFFNLSTKKAYFIDTIKERRAPAEIIMKNICNSLHLAHVKDRLFEGDKTSTLSYSTITTLSDSIINDFEKVVNRYTNIQYYTVDVANQTDGFNCGIHIMEFAEFIALNYKLDHESFVKALQSKVINTELASMERKRFQFNLFIHDWATNPQEVLEILLMNNFENIVVKNKPSEVVKVRKTLTNETATSKRSIINIEK